MSCECQYYSNNLRKSQKFVAGMPEFVMAIEEKSNLTKILDFFIVIALFEKTTKKLSFLPKDNVVNKDKLGFTKSLVNKTRQDKV